MAVTRRLPPRSRRPVRRDPATDRARAAERHVESLDSARGRTPHGYLHPAHDRELAEAHLVAADATEEAGDHERAQYHRGRAHWLTIEKPNYIARELRDVQIHIEREERDARTWSRDRREIERANLAEALRDRELIDERIGWLFNGTFGAGAQIMAYDIVSRGGNREAALLRLLIVQDFFAPPSYAASAWGLLSRPEQVALTRTIRNVWTAAIREAPEPSSIA